MPTLFAVGELLFTAVANIRVGICDSGVLSRHQQKPGLAFLHTIGPLQLLKHNFWSVHARSRLEDIVLPEH